MAVAISTTPNIADTTPSIAISYTGVLVGTNYKLDMALRINGVNVQTYTITPVSSSGTITFTPVNVKSSIWANAAGKSLSGAVTVYALNYNSSTGTSYGSATKTGSLTINTRLTNFTSNGANINLDGNSYIKGSWTNPNTTYFRGAFTATMSGGTVGSATEQNTYYDYSVNPGTAWYNNANSLLGSASSATITYSLNTQFRTNAGWQNQGSSGSYTGTVTKTQYYKAEVTSFENFTVEPGLTIYYGATEGGGGTGLTYSVEIRIDGNKIFGRAATSTMPTSITVTTEEVNALYTALAGAPSKTATVALASYKNGTWFGESTRTATAYNVVALITSFTNTERSGTSLSFSYVTDTQVDSVDYKIGAAGAWVNALTGLEVTSGTFQITGLTASTSYTVYLRVQHPTSEQYTTSNPITVSTVNTSIISNTPNFDIKTGATIPIEISKVVTTMLHTIYLKSFDETVTYQSLTNVDLTATMSLTPTTVTALYAATPAVSSIKLYLVCESLLNGVSQGTTKKEITATVTEALPTVSGATYLDVNPTIQAILLNNQKILQGKSTLKITATGMTSQKSASLAALTVRVGQNEYSVSLSGTSVASQEITVGVVNEDALSSVIIRVIDSRGITSNTLELPIQFIPYRVPTFVEFEIQRVNNYYADAFFKATYEINSVITNAVQRNNVAISYRYKLQSDTVWGAWVNVTNPTPSISGDKLRYTVNVFAGSTFDMTAVYSVEARISDTFTPTPIVSTSYIPKGMGHIEFYEEYVNFGVQPYFTDSQSVEHALIHEANLSLVLQVVYPVGSIYISTNATNPATLFGFGTWTAFAEGRTLIGVGTSDQEFTAGLTGGESEHALTSTEIPVHDTVMTATTSTTEVAINSYSADGAPHNNLPPYIVTYMWERTA